MLGEKEARQDLFPFDLDNHEFYQCSGLFSYFNVCLGSSKDVSDD